MEAHSDSIGTIKNNLDLSLKRAMIIKNYMINQGIIESRIKLMAYGESKPKVSNMLKKGRQINRRVTAKIISF